MKYRRLGKTDYSVSEVSLGTWQVESNVTASELPHPPVELIEELERLYEKRVKPLVHQRW